MQPMPLDLQAEVRTRKAIRRGAARALRIEADLSQADLARHLADTTGAAPPPASMISRWERGERRPTGSVGRAYVELVNSLIAETG